MAEKPTSKVGVSIRPFIAHQLAEVARLLSYGCNTPKSIDEVVVIGSGGQVLLSVTANDRQVSGENLENLAVRLEKDRRRGESPVIIGLDGQEAENFDLLVPVTVFDESLEPIAEYHVFGNYLNGTLGELMKSPRWVEAQNHFFCFAESLCQILHMRD